MVICMVLQDEDLYPSDASWLELVWTQWTQLPEMVKDAWRTRADYLNCQSRQGIYHKLP